MEEPYVAEISLYPYNFAPVNWITCSGQLLEIRPNTALFSLLGTKFGGDGKTTFALPNYQAVNPENMQYCIALGGIFPGGGRPTALGEIAVLPFKPPSPWIECAGQLLQIANYQDLFKILGTTFGGDGQTTFGVPNLSSTSPPVPNQTSYFISPVTDQGLVDAFMGEIRLFPFKFSPNHWSTCAGQLLTIAQNTALFTLIGDTFGGDGKQTFALPNLSSAAVPQGLQYMIALDGLYPERG